MRMEFIVHSKEKMVFPSVCFHCLSETQNVIHVDLKKKEHFSDLLFHMFSHFSALKDVGTSVKIPYCRNCSARLLATRLSVFVFFIALLCILVYGIAHPETDLSMYSFLVVILIPACPIFYVMLKEEVMGFSVFKNDEGYFYFFKSDKYPEYLKSKGHIEDYEISS